MLNSAVIDAAQIAFQERFDRGISEDELRVVVQAAFDASMPEDVKGLVERLLKRASTMNGSLVGASDGATYTLGYYDQFAAADDKAATDHLTALSAALAAKDAEIARLTALSAALVQHVEENVWNAYNIGIEQDGRWMDGARSEGEWLASELGLEPGWHDAATIKAELPALVERIVARAALAGEDGR